MAAEQDSFSDDGSKPTAIRWNSALERLIAGEGEKCLCFQWLHTRSETLYSYWNNYLSLPSIALSTLIGSLSVGASSVFPGKSDAQIYIGFTTIVCAMLQAINSFFAFPKKAESHRNAHVAYGKLYRFISVEMALPRRERMEARLMLKSVREQIDRLTETAPAIPASIIKLFKREFSSSLQVTKPEITNGLHSIVVYSGDNANTTVVSQEQVGFPNYGKETEKIKLGTEKSGETPVTVGRRNSTCNETSIN